MGLKSNAFDHDAIPVLLESVGIIPTSQRIEIANIMFVAPQHLSADEVLSALRRAGSSVSKATVYNTLRRFAECGLLRQVIVDPSKVFYDSNTKPHYHLYDVETGKLTDFDENELPINTLPDLPADTIIQGIDVVVRVKRVRGADGAPRQLPSHTFSSARHNEE